PPRSRARPSGSRGSSDDAPRLDRGDLARRRRDRGAAREARRGERRRGDQARHEPLPWGQAVPDHRRGRRRAAPPRARGRPGLARRALEGDGRVMHSAALLPAVSLQIGGGGEHVSSSLQIVALLTLLSLAPAILIMLTGFVRIVIVLSFLRQAVGTQQMPPNQVIVSLALFLTFFVMLPTLREINEQAIGPYQRSEISDAEALSRAYEPLSQFMLRQTREKDLALFVDATATPRPDSPSALPPQALVP